MPHTREAMTQNARACIHPIALAHAAVAVLAFMCLAAAPLRAQAPSQDRPRFSAQATAQEISSARIFEEPLLPFGATPSAEENAALGRALSAFLARADHDDFTAFARFLADHPHSSWKASLLCNLGLAYFRTGYFSKALEAWEESWSLAKHLTTAEGHAIGDRALSELIVMNARVGRFERLDALFQEFQGRNVRGTAAERIIAAKEARWDMENRPEVSFMCGPLALQRMHHAARPGAPFPRALQTFVSTDKGTSLWQVRTVARASGLAYEAVKRSGSVPVPVPSVIHWKVGHFAAVVGFSNGRYRIADPTFGSDMWVTPKSLDHEASGYFLSPTTGLPSAFKVMGQKEAEGVWGKGRFSRRDGGATTPDDAAAGGAAGDGTSGPGGKSPGGLPGGEPGSDPGCGMPVYRFHAMLNSLNLTDIPLWYRPARGPKVEFRIDYNQKEGGQPALFTYPNIGNKWTPAWVSWVADDPAVPEADAEVHPLGGGSERYQGFEAATASYKPGFRSGTGLFRVSASPIRYERRFPDGSKHVFDLAEGATAFPRRIFLTRVIDPQGLSLTFAYDASFRLATVTDALGKVTTLTYGNAADTRRITKVTDPFGRFATLEYNASGQLSKVTDMGGLASTFAYGESDEITSMTTPYGITQFRSGLAPFSVTGSKMLTSWAEAIDPLGQKERLEYRHISPWLEADPTAAPDGITASLGLKTEASTLFWGKKAMAEAPGDPKSAKVFHWMRYAEHMIDLYTSILHSTKEPLEDRVWLNYYNQAGATVAQVGMVGWPTRIGRFLDDGSTQLTQVEYNPKGNPIKFVDPSGRATVLTYDAAGINVLTVRQQQGTVNELLATFTWNGQNRPLTSKDASGQTTTYTWNAQGQLLTVTNANAERTTYAYNADGRLATITGAQAADITTFTYDIYGRVASRQEPDGYLVRFEYDNLDRLTKVTYPDNTYEQITYNKLDAEWHRDRLGRFTRTVVNALRQPVSVTDPAQRTTTLDWCACGDLKALVDASGKRTEWKRDVQGRLTEKLYPDGRTDRYAYETRTSRLKSRTDAKNQTANYAYFGDDNLKQVSYTGGTVPTPSVSYTYDAAYDRVRTLVDGTGTTTYAYKAVAATPTLGSARLLSVDGPLANDVITFTYDKLGRVSGRSINGSSVTWAYDNLGRTTSEVGPLGTFTFAYVGVTGRLASTLYPNSQKTEYLYRAASGDFLLQEIKNLTPALAALSKHNYTYDAEGRIKTWTQQADAATASIHEIEYDAADQLAGVVVKSAATGNPVQKHFAYAYDKSGNRTTAQENASVTTFAYNSVNQLTSQTAGGRMRFHGTVSEAATVTVDGAGVSVGGDRKFDGSAQVRSGKDTVVVAAKDYANNTRTNKYEVNATGSARSYTYDLNGNLTGDGTRTYEWDAENRLTAVVQGAVRSEFTYDGLWRRVRMVEKNGTTVTSDKRFLWVGNQIAEERDAAGGTVLKRFFGLGAQVATTRYFYTKDHLGSIRELTNDAGAVQARYEYDPWGNRTRVAGTQTADFGYTGHYHHGQSGLVLTKYRAYSPGMGRWISRDPIEEDDGPNLYAYVSNNTLNKVDELGLTGSVALDWPTVCRAAAAAGATAVAVAAAPGVVTVVAGVTIAVVVSSSISSSSEKRAAPVDPTADEPNGHKKKRPSTKEKHEKGDKRRKADRGGEKADDRRPQWK